ncbi:thiol-disulfide oxidoreductase DCC family protein [Geothrix sp. 21YS21S-4]|uniref:thiol-disulfide oxidoreductase DCC family protein n=1 Tax=Geothrix sp. 21YS21S-4 TaxID=3068889 RepID=UPI0027BACB9A|nr:DUF393 domain-containing protein [Geothrix sp. 21YS21S-4]
MGAGEGLTRLFYDGGCGLCHAAVAFVARRDRKGRVRFAPLGGITFERLVHGPLPDSLAVLTPDGRLLLRSAAVLHVIRQLGGVWALVALFGGVGSRPLLDRLYDWVARHRARLFPRPVGTCPVLPAGLRERFDP